ncbi:MAG: hypothetical protein ACRCZB_05385 [Bacteroidales bacterium]
MKQRLIENISLAPSNYQNIGQSLNESNSTLMVEGLNYKSLAIFRFEFTRPNKKNLNGRIYPYALWDKVIAENKTTLALADHPEESSGRPHDIWAVVRNPSYSEDRLTVTADCYILDNELGRSALAVLEAGGEVGLSSSGYGDFMADGITVSAETFELERYFDWVLSPSYQIFGKQEDKISEASKKIQDPLTEETTMTVKELSLREKREFELSMEKILAKTSSIEDPSDKLLKVKEALSFYDDVNCTFYKKEFEELLESTQKEVDSMFEKAKKADGIIVESLEAKLEIDFLEKEIKTKDSIIADLTKRIEEADAKLKTTSESLNESSEVVKSLTAELSKRVPFEDFCKLREFAEKATKLLAEKRTEISSLKFSNSLLKEESELNEKRLDALVNKSLLEKTKNMEYQKRIDEARIQKQVKIQESKERELVEHARPSVLEYYNDLVARGEDVEGLREGILTKKTLTEAQSFFLRHKKHPVFEPTKTFLKNDLSLPLEGRGYKVKSTVSLPKGFL